MFIGYLFFTIAYHQMSHFWGAFMFSKVYGSSPHQSHFPFNKALKSVNYSSPWHDVLCHLLRNPHELKTRGWATSALSSATGSCQHFLTSPGGAQLGLRSCSAQGPLSSSSCYLSLWDTHFSNTFHINAQSRNIAMCPWTIISLLLLARAHASVWSQRPSDNECPTLKHRTEAFINLIGPWHLCLFCRGGMM